MPFPRAWWIHIRFPPPNFFFFSPSFFLFLSFFFPLFPFFVFDRQDPAGAAGAGLRLRGQRLFAGAQLLGGGALYAAPGLSLRVLG